MKPPQKRTTVKSWFLVMCFAVSQGAQAQQPSPASSPTPVTAPAPRPPWIAQIGFDHYAADNRRLVAHPDPTRVILMGDSVTEFWKTHDPSLFESEHFINRGISGQTTLQMLLRFRADVVQLHPAAVVLFAGINDLAQNVGPESVEIIEGNLQSMAEIAYASKIPVLFCSILPTDHFPWHAGLAPAADIQAINTWMRHYAADHGSIYVDYASALAGQDGLMPKKYATDGVHPTDAGYAVMRPLLETNVAQTIK